MRRIIHSSTSILWLLTAFFLSACQVTMLENGVDAVANNSVQLETNKAIVQRFYDEIWTEGDLTVIDEIIAEDFIDRFSGRDGREAFVGTVNFFRNAYPDFEATYTDVVAEGDLVVAYITYKGTYQGGMEEAFGVPDSVIGTEIVLNGVDYARIENGMIVEGWGAHDELGRFMQFGFELVPPSE